jgi:hypothetical protein
MLLRMVLQSGLFCSVFATKLECAPLPFPIHATFSAVLILLYLITRIPYGEALNH